MLAGVTPWPIESMGLVYLPTFTQLWAGFKVNMPNFPTVVKYTSPMDDMVGGFWEVAFHHFVWAADGLTLNPARFWSSQMMVKGDQGSCPLSPLPHKDSGLGIII